ncbi:hypothetical protein ACIQXF_04660 [Lysinibacillus sp. NPDC097231]|uniref:hypothetical protein n=1 Tax=Lysinibacillus sp. NPDC097231 TaxID=3364142 RepID=UPI0038273AEC
MKRYEGSPAVVIERRKGTPDSPFNNMNETLVVTGDGKVLLSEIPNELNRVIVTSDDNTTWYEIKEGQITENAFKVDYINKLVTFNTIHVGKQLHFKYVGEGNHYYSPHSIYTKLEDKTVVETLGDIVEGGKHALDALGALNEKLDEVTQATDDAREATNDAITTTNDARDVIDRGEQVIADATAKINEMDDKIVEVNDKLLVADTKLKEVDDALLEVDHTIQNANQSIDNINTVINEAVQTTNNAQLLIDEAKSVGEFVLSKQYKKNNTVLHNGSTWIALQDTQHNPLPILPVRENTYWRLVAQRGIDGNGSVVSVNGISPDVDGNVPLSAYDIDAITQSELDDTENKVTSFVTEHGIGSTNAKDITPPSELFNLSKSGFYNVIHHQGDNTMPDEMEDYHTYVGFNKNDDMTTMFYFAISKTTGKTYTRSRSKNSNSIINDSEWIEGGGFGSGSGGGKFSTITYDLTTTQENQKSWELPKNSYDKNNDSIIVFHNGSNLSTISWDISGDAFNGYTLNIPDNPIKKVIDNNVRIMVFKNLPTDGTESFSGSLLEDGTVSLEKLGQDVQDAIKKASGNSFFIPYTLSAIIENQKAWELPTNSYDGATDSLLVFHNRGILDKESWNITGDAGSGYTLEIPDNPISDIEDNNVLIIVLKNASSEVPNGFSGTLLTPSSVGLDKLGQDVQEAINNTSGKVEIVNDLITGGDDKVASAETVKILKKQLAEHLEEDVLSEEGAHGIRYFNNELAVKNDENQWEVVETGAGDKAEYFEGDLNTLTTAGTYMFQWDKCTGLPTPPLPGYFNNIDKTDKGIIIVSTVVRETGQVLTLQTLKFETLSIQLVLSRFRKEELEYKWSRWSTPNGFHIFAGNTSVSSIYVDPVNGKDDISRDGTKTQPLKTIRFALMALGKVIEYASVIICMSSGFDHGDIIEVNGLTGSRLAVIFGDNDRVGMVRVRECSSLVEIKGSLPSAKTKLTSAGISASESQNVLLLNFDMTPSSANIKTYFLNCGIVQLSNCEIPNASQYGVYFDNCANALISNITGTGNATGIFNRASTVRKIGTGNTITGTIPQTIEGGGQIL